MELRYLEPGDERWRALALAHPDGMAFHLPEWVNLIGNCYGYHMFVAAQLDGGKLVSGVPLAEVRSWLTGRRAVALPFTDFCLPLAEESHGTDGLIQALASDVRRGRWPRLELHWPLPPGEGTYQGEATIRHATALSTDVDELARRLRSSTVRLIRQAEKTAVVVRQAESWQDLECFYRLHVETRQRQGVPVQPARFFRSLWDGLLSRGLGFALLAWKGSEPIAGAVFLHTNKTITYKYGASRPAHWQLRPNNLIFWTALRWGCEHGYAAFDWGKTDPDNEGLRNFKRGWAAEETLIHYSTISFHTPKPNAKRFGHILAPAIQRSPSWLGRTIGELMYGHFA